MPLPNTWRVPFMSMTFDSSRAFQGPSTLQYSVLLIGQRLSGGTRPELNIDLITNDDQGSLYYGEGSQLDLMVRAWRNNNTVSKVYAISLDDAVAGIAATGSYVIGGTATKAGSLVLYIGGKRLAVAVAIGDTATQIGDKVVAALPSSYPVTISNAAGTLTVTAKNKGEAGNDIPLDANYSTNEDLPSGITLSINAMTSGANNPDLSEVIDVIGDTWYQVMVCPYYDDPNMVLMDTELEDRFGPIRQIDATYFTSRRGSVGTLSTWGNGKNSKHICVPYSTNYLSTSIEFATAWAAQITKSGQNDPAQPLQTLALNGIVPPREKDRFIIEERNILLYDGISTSYVDSGGVARIERAITQYQKNELGADDIAYLDVNTLFTLRYLRYDFNNYINTKYPRAKLADDNVNVGPGQVVMTPSLGKAEAINRFNAWERLGLVENASQFKNDLQCFRSEADPNKLEWILPPDLVNQFRVGDSTLQFLLDTPNA